MQLYFSRLTREELREAKRYYNDLQKDLGEQLKLEALAAENSILHNPLAWQVELGEIRRFLLNRFPYKILYMIDGEKIVVIAFMHQHQAPDYWIDRAI